MTNINSFFEGSAGLLWFDEKYDNKMEFTTSGTFTNTTGAELDVVVGICGGGGGGATGTNPGGGGGSGMTYHKVTLSIGEAVLVTVGVGGLPTFDGGDTSFGAYFTAKGGKTPVVGNQNIGKGMNGGTDGAAYQYIQAFPLQLSKVVDGVQVFKIITPNTHQTGSVNGRGGCGGGYDYEGRGAGTLEPASGYGAGGTGGITSPNNTGTDGICVVWY